VLLVSPNSPIGSSSAPSVTHSAPREPATLARPARQPADRRRRKRSAVPDARRGRRLIARLGRSSGMHRWQTATHGLSARPRMSAASLTRVDVDLRCPPGNRVSQHLRDHIAAAPV